ncbi:citrate transporter [Schizosaccharomyces cryophilus OY26]|uniref:Citrate transporter n=1 Tax=Schizosaccharomyces cryophilus (strain OY26 / ATCC MYA-4695 / CBS 11777 / NBRC 106824 / NRRL Y48691) TaxID=653667 RepID=S9VUK1_SCHCR|nr:citrate transporter [Schizosaccharomyces cryophilus OY26]EPY51468.1 citrate transporter [Schizosaccharomyces cryophilus OY26]
MATTVQNDKKIMNANHPGPGKSILAGGIAGAVEISITYPAEFAKTRLQLYRNVEGVKGKLPRFGLEWYKGCSTVIIGNSLKAAVRFFAFDSIKKTLADENGHLSGPRTVLAGLGAGVAESILVLTPFESIKTAIIDEGKKPNPRFSGFLQASKSILIEGGISALYRGLAPTVARQATNSGVRFTAYNSIKQSLQSRLPPDESLGTVSTFLIGSIAGIITVYCTQPIDTIKSRMQSLTAKQEYKNSFHCAYKVFTQDGVLRFWSGATPRLARLILSGGIVFTVYEKVMGVLQLF